MKKGFIFAPLLTVLLTLSGCAPQASAPSDNYPAPVTPPVTDTTTPPVVTEPITPPAVTDTTTPTTPTKPATPVATPPVTKPKPAATTHNVAIQNFAFSPATVSIKTGDKVIWTNSDSMAHTITSSGFASGNLDSGTSFSHKFDKAGTYDYNCSIHPSMKGKVVVVD